MEDFSACLHYIDAYWNRILCSSPNDHDVHIGLPHRFYTPNDNFFKEDQFYWDSYFIARAILLKGDVHIVKGIVENFAYLYNKFGIIPLRNKMYNLGISQPPFLSSLVVEVYKEIRDKEWLASMADVVQRELFEYWSNRGNIGMHLLQNGLSRYCDHEITHVTAEHESGWDMTSRFANRCLDFAAIDLNALLYKYETDLVFMFKELGNKQKVKDFTQAAKKRKELINKYCWSQEKGFFFDYDAHNNKQSSFFSLAGFYPLWVGLATHEQAEMMKDKLKLFECKGGLANTQAMHLSKEFKQWDFPNGWPNQQLIVIEALHWYGFNDDAHRLATKWLQLNKRIFEKTGTFWEKYDVVACDVGKLGRYPTQAGFAWSNAVFFILYKEFFS